MGLISKIWSSNLEEEYMYKKKKSFKVFFFPHWKTSCQKAAETVSKQEIKYCTIIRIQQHYHVQEIRTKSTIHNCYGVIYTIKCVSCWQCMPCQQSTNALDYNTYKHCLHTMVYCIYSAYIYTNLASHIEIYPVMPPVLKKLTRKSSVLSTSHL